NFASNAVATVLIGSWTREFNADQAHRVFSGKDPFNEATLLDEPTPPGPTPADERMAHNKVGLSPSPTIR
ncbi:MAG: hypothetical protein ACRDTT_06635, partial [Pseudonocardiaceae bacterium]